MMGQSSWRGAIGINMTEGMRGPSSLLFNGGLSNKLEGQHLNSAYHGPIKQAASLVSYLAGK